MSKSDVFKLPPGMELIELSDGLRFKGTADQIETLASEIRKISNLKEGESLSMGKYVFIVSETIHEPEQTNIIQLPKDAWKIMASKFNEVAYDWEESPFDFNSCGYIRPRISFDLGVELVGEANYDRPLYL